MNTLKIGHEIGVDAFYHIRMGDLFPEICSTKIFPWTQLSLWKSNFYDKELGFHAIISFLRYFDIFFNIPVYPPFNFINIFLVAVILIVYTVINFVNNLSTTWLTPCILLCISPLFLLRLNMIRPQLLSITLFGILIWLLISNINYRKKCFYTFIIAWIYTISYSSPQLMLLAIFSFIIAEIYFRKNRLSKLFLILLMAVSGIFTGLLIHPQFPNTFYAWYVQGVLVVKRMLGYINPDLDLGLELGSPDLTTILCNFSIYILTIINIFLYFKSQTKRSSALMLIILSTTCAIGFLFSERFIEYAVPSVTLCFVNILSQTLKERKIVLSLKFQLIKLLIFIIVIPILFFSFKLVTEKQFFPCYGFAQWVEKNIKPGTYIGQIRWGEFPRLFFVAPQYRYSMAMDPMFSYVKYPKETLLLEQFKLLKRPVSPLELRKTLRTNLVFISRYDTIPAKYLISKGAKILYKGYDGWLLELS